MSLQVTAGSGRSFRTFGPFDAMRIRDGRYLEVREGRKWWRIAFSIPLHSPPKYSRELRKARPSRVFLPGEEKVRSRAYAIWRFLNRDGTEMGYDAKSLNFRTDD